MTPHDRDLKTGEAYGKEVLPVLAARYQQLYLIPGAEGAERWKTVVRRGEAADGGSLAHFRGNDADSLIWKNTPAGPVQLVTLHERADFVLFLQIMAHRCERVEIPASQGAMFLSGLVDWQRIRAHLAQFPAERQTEEFKRFTAKKENYTDALIILSAGPYSGVGAERVGLAEGEWLRCSLTIREYHECTHFVCRKNYPERIDAVWDELAADCVGVYAAYGRLVPELVELFLGVDANRYVGGRLADYMDAPDDAEKARRLDALAPVLHAALGEIVDVVRQRQGIDPLELALLLGRMDPPWK